jgi:hypothetical protein
MDVPARRDDYGSPLSSFPFRADCEITIRPFRGHCSGWEALGRFLRSRSRFTILVLGDLRNFKLRRRDDREVAAASDLAILDKDSRATSKGQAL